MTRTLFIPGTPRGQGSMRFHQSKNGKTSVRYADNVYEWRNRITHYCLQTWDERQSSWAMNVTMTFVLARPKNHYGTGRNSEVLKAGAPAHPTGPVDLDKMIRAVNDAVTDAGNTWHDDAQVVAITATKRWAAIGEQTGVHLTITAIAPPEPVAHHPADGVQLGLLEQVL